MGQRVFKKSKMFQVLSPIVREARHVHTLTCPENRTTGRKTSIENVNSIRPDFAEVILHRPINRRRGQHEARNEEAVYSNIRLRIPVCRDDGRQYGPTNIKVIQAVL